jgi:hypothetical protein
VPESFVQTGPDSTGKKIRTRQRTVGANTVEEQYAIVQPHDRVPVSRVWYSSLRIPSQASASFPLMSIYNTGTNPVSVRRLSIEASTATASAALSPYVRLYRVIAAPTGGSTVTGVQQDTSDAAINAGVVVRQAASADGTYSAISATASPPSPMWSQVLPRYHTLTGFSPQAVMNLLPDDSVLNSEDPLILRTNQGCMVRFEAAAAPAVNVWQILVKTVLTEFTQP